MRHFEIIDHGDITSLREKLHVLMAGQTILLEAPIFELRAGDARHYRLQLGSSGTIMTLARKNSKALTALREITLPLDRPVVLLVESTDNFDQKDLDAVSCMAGIGHDGPALHKGSLILCGPNRVFWV